jgi:rRNA maturation endonuclease Nob1
MTDQNQSTRVCPGCGREISTVHAFCPYCGKPRGPAGFEGATAQSQPQGERLCPGCGRKIPEGLRFCPYCGRPGPSGPPMNAPSAQATRLCPGCGREIQEGLAFCPYCGRPGPSGPVPGRTEAAAPVAQPPSSTPQAPPSAMKVVCIACGKEVPDGLNFCPMCGKAAPYARPPSTEIKAADQMTRKCVGCGRDIPLGLNFCPYCGHQYNTTSPVANAASGPSSSPSGAVPPVAAAAQPTSEPIINKIRCMGCGREFPGNLNFCPYCGRVNVASSAAPAPTSIKASQSDASPQPSTSNQPAMRLCMGCGKQIPEGLKFCPYCGRPAPEGSARSEVAAPSAPATRVCPGCGLEISTAHKFCPECGRPRDLR